MFGRVNVNILMEKVLLLADFFAFSFPPQSLLIFVAFHTALG